MTNLFEITEDDYNDLCERAKHWALVNGKNINRNKDTYYYYYYCCYLNLI